MIVENASAFVVFKPMVTSHRRIVFVDLAVTLLPVKAFALADPVPVANVVDDKVANVMGNPLAD